MSLPGSRCAECGCIVYGTLAACSACGSRAVAPVDLSPAGTMETYTVIGAAVLAEVRLRDGVLILARIETTEPRVGQEVAYLGDEEGIVFGAV